MIINKIGHNCSFIALAATVILSACGMEKDSAAPSVVVSSFKNGDSAIASTQVIIAGSAADNDAVHSIGVLVQSIAGDSTVYERETHFHSRELTFSDTFLMPAFDVNVKVLVEDHAENKTSLELKLFRK